MMCSSIHKFIPNYHSVASNYPVASPSHSVQLPEHLPSPFGYKHYRNCNVQCGIHQNWYRSFSTFVQPLQQGHHFSLVPNVSQVPAFPTTYEPSIHPSDATVGRKTIASSMQENVLYLTRVWKNCKQTNVFVNDCRLFKTQCYIFGDKIKVMHIIKIIGK